MAQSKKPNRHHSSNANPERAKRVTRRDELEFGFKYEVLKRVYSLGRILIVGAVIVWLAYFAYQSITVMAGRSTDFRSVIEWAASFHISEGCAWVLVVILGVGCGRYRHLYKREMKDRSERTSALEKLVDPLRTSSNLTKHGDSPPGEPS